MWTTLAWLLTCTSAVQFDSRDPIASHPEMQALVNDIVSRRRALDGENELSQTDKNDITAMHNKIRAQTARGEVAGYYGNLPEATNMIKLQWSDDLAEVARDYSMGCSWGHNGNRGSELSSLTGGEWTSCGENLAGNSACPVTWSSSVSCGGSWTWDDMGLKQSIEDGWSIDEAADMEWDYSGSSYGISHGGAIGHYTQVVWADTAYVGCGFSKCSSYPNTYFTCNYYPPGNYPQEPYEPGSTGSNCPSDYPIVLSSDPYTDQDGEYYDLSGLCTVDPGSSDSDTTETPTADDSATDSEDCSCFTISSASTSDAVNGLYLATQTPIANGVELTCSRYQSDSGMYLERRCYTYGCFWGFYPEDETSPDWYTYGYCSTTSDASALGSCTAWSNDANVVEGCDATDVLDRTENDEECVAMSGWKEATGDSTFGDDASEWKLYTAQPEYNGYPVYKWTGGDWYMYVMSGMQWYYIGSVIGTRSSSKLKYGCGTSFGVHIPILECDGVGSRYTDLSFYECGGEPLILDACLDDAAEYVRFLLDGDDESEYMQFALYEDVGCWGDSDEPVWMHLDEVANATYYLHRDVDADSGRWRITQHLIEGNNVYECFEDNIEDCTAGTWNEHYSLTNSTVGVVRGVRVLDTATVEVSASAAEVEDEEGLSPIDDAAIVAIVLLIVGVVGVVALLWRRRRNSKKGAVTFDAQDQEMGAAQTTHTVGDAEE